MSFALQSDRARSTLWVVDCESDRQHEVPNDRGLSSSPRWSPDDTRLAFVSASEAGSEILIYSMSDGSTASVARLDSSVRDLAWSPDGHQLAFIGDVDQGTAFRLGVPLPQPDGASWASPLTIVDHIPYRADGRGSLGGQFSQLFVVSAVPDSSGIRAQPVTSGPWDIAGPLAWSADGHAVLFSSERREQADRRPADTDIYTVDLSSRSLTALTHRHGADFAVQVSPDGSKIAYLHRDATGHNYDNTELYVMNRDGSAQRSLSARLDRSIESAKWCGNEALCALFVDHGLVRVARFALNGAVQTVAEGLAGSGLDLPFVRDATFSVSRSGLIAYSGGDALHPPDVFLASRGHPPRRLTDLNGPLLASRELASVVPFPVRAADGAALDAWVVKPPHMPAGTAGPLILEIHGGPYQTYGSAFSIVDQLYAAAGYTVLYMNPRGSTSYGARFARAIDREFPGPSENDLLAAVDQAVHDGIADPHRLFVTGMSAGGFLTAWLVGKTHRFNAAVAQLPVINWTSWRLTTDKPAQYFPAWFTKQPWEDPGDYWTRSPLSLVGAVTTPTLVIGATDDYIVRVTEAEQYFTALQLRGVPSALITIPGAGHNSTADRPSQLAARISAIIAWFDRFGGR